MPSQELGNRNADAAFSRRTWRGVGRARHHTYSGARPPAARNQYARSRLRTVGQCHDTVISALLLDVTKSHRLAAAAFMSACTVIRAGGQARHDALFISSARTSQRRLLLLLSVA